MARIAKETGLTRQTIYRIKDDPAGAEAALPAWGLAPRSSRRSPMQLDEAVRPVGLASIVVEYVHARSPCRLMANTGRRPSLEELRGGTWPP
jgi:hypothetical protein